MMANKLIKNKQKHKKSIINESIKWDHNDEEEF